MELCCLLCSGECNHTFHYFHENPHQRDNTHDDKQYEDFGVLLEKKKGMTLVAYTTMLVTSRV